MGNTYIDYLVISQYGYGTGKLEVSKVSKYCRMQHLIIIFSNVFIIYKNILKTKSRVDNYLII